MLDFHTFLSIVVSFKMSETPDHDKLITELSNLTGIEPRVVSFYIQAKA